MIKQVMGIVLFVIPLSIHTPLFIFATNAIMDRLKADAVFAAVLE
jgi:hypothetical protein